VSKATSATSARYSSTSNYSKNGAKATSATSATYSSTANYAKAIPSTVATRLSDLESYSNVNYIYTGRIENTIIPAQSYKLIEVQFESSYRVVPKVIPTLFTTSTDPNYGDLTIGVGNITVSGFELMVWNNNDGSLEPGFLYIAIGKM